jgi:RNA polymerase subunit RPABC4/transcription elongation factor Spt4
MSAAVLTASVFTGVHNFFHSRTWHAVALGLIAFGLLFWLATVFWVVKDARRRIEDPFLIALATLIGAVPPFIGPLIYMLFRPPEYLDDVRERELEIRAIESRLGGSEQKCKVCGHGIEHDFLVCPVCTTKLRAPCTSCSRPLEPAWQVCPYCATPVAGDTVAIARPRRTRSPRTPRSTGTPS